MEIISLITCVITTVIIGWSLLNIIFHRAESLGFPERLALSYGLGMGVVTVQMFFYYFLGIRHSLLNLLLPWAPVVIVAFFIAKPKGPVRGGVKQNPLTLFEKFLLGGICLEVLLAFSRAFLKPLESFDSIAIYAIRSKAIYLSGGIPANFFSEINLNFPNFDYPLLVPLAEVWVYKFLGSLNDLLVKAIFPMYFLSFLVLFFFLLNRFLSRKAALLFTFLLATIPQLNHFATIGYADFILGYYFSIAVMLVYLWIKKGNIQVLALSAVFLTLAAWTKNEGIVLGLAAFVSVILFLARNFNKKRLKEVLVFALIVMTLSAPWNILKASMGLENRALHFETMDIGRVKDIFADPERFLIILYEFQKQFFGPKKWNIVWILFFTLLILNFRKLFSDELKYVLLPIILAFIIYISVYLMIPAEFPLQWWVGTTASRLFIHFVPLVVFWLANYGDTSQRHFSHRWEVSP